MTLSSAELERFVADLAARPALWRHLISHSSEARMYRQVWDQDHVNAWLICWTENQDTGFHDHDDSAAAIRVLEGQVVEERLRVGAPPEARAIEAGATVFVPPTAIHRVLHGGRIPATTIHAYSPPLRRTGAYRIGPGGVLERASLSGGRELRAEPAMS
jgi:mannose-6-phosphate isomerase-like protein (cupin superfamily)